MSKKLHCEGEPGATACIEFVGGNRLALSGMLNFDTVPGLSRKLKALFHHAGTMEVDLAQVEHANSAGVALLVEWVVMARRADNQVRFLNMPAQMLAIAKVSGLAELLPLEQVDAP